MTLSYEKHRKMFFLFDLFISCSGMRKCTTDWPYSHNVHRQVILPMACFFFFTNTFLNFQIFCVKKNILISCCFLDDFEQCINYRIAFVQVFFWENEGRKRKREKLSTDITYHLWIPQRGSVSWLRSGMWCIRKWRQPIGWETGDRSHQYRPIACSLGADGWHGWSLKLSY